MLQRLLQSDLGRPVIIMSADKNLGFNEKALNPGQWGIGKNRLMTRRWLVLLMWLKKHRRWQMRGFKAICLEFLASCYLWG